MRNIVYKVTWKNMKMNMRRTWTSFFGIFFMVLLITCVFVGRKTAVGYLENVSSQIKGKWHATMYDMTEKEYETLGGESYIKEMGRSADKGYVEFPQSANDQKPYLFIKSYEAPCFDWMNIHVREGRLPGKKGEIVISQSALDDGAKISIGDTVKAEYFDRTVTGLQKGVTTVFPFQQIELAGGETEKLSQDFPFYENNESFRIDKEYTGMKDNLTVVGIVDEPWFEQEGAAGYLAFTCYDAERDGIFNIACLFDLENEHYDMYQNIREIAGSREVAFNDYVLAFSGRSSDSVVNFMVQLMTIFFMVLIVLAAIVLIYNVFNISFEERSRYLGMLCSVGATGKQKRSSVYFEAFSLFLPALPLGILAGCLVVLLGMNLLLPFIYSFMSGLAVLPEKVPVHLSISAWDILIIAFSGGLTVLLSAILPAVKISRIGPIECIRGNLDKNPGRLKEGAKSSMSLSAEKMLAKNSLRYQRRKTRGMRRAASIFMLILIVTTATTQILTQLITIRMQDSDIVNVKSEGWDYQLSVFNGNAGEEYEKLKEEIKNDVGVEAVREEYSGTFVGNVPRDVMGKEYWNALHRVFNLYYHRELSDEEFQGMFEEGTNVVSVIGVDDETFENIAEATDTDQKLLESGTPTAIVVNSGEVSTANWVVSEKEPEKYEFHEIEHMTDLGKGEKLPMTIYSPKEEKQVDFPLLVAGYGSKEQLEKYYTFHSESLWVIVELDTCEKMNQIMAEDGNEESGSMMEPTLYMKMNGKKTGLIKRLNALTEADEMHYIFARADRVKTISDTLCSMIRILLLCFVLLTSVICLLNLYNSIHGWIAEQKPHFAMLVSVGATQEQIRRMLMYETLQIFLGSCVSTLLIVTPLILAVRYLLIDQFGAVRIGFPWLVYAAAIFITVIVIFGFMLYHYHREKDYRLQFTG